MIKASSHIERAKARSQIAHLHDVPNGVQRREEGVDAREADRVVHVVVQDEGELVQPVTAALGVVQYLKREFRGHNWVKAAPKEPRNANSLGKTFC